jgi:hypothetical protein
VGASPVEGAAHVSVTVVPLTFAETACGALGAAATTSDASAIVMTPMKALRLRMMGFTLVNDQHTPQAHGTATQRYADDLIQSSDQ